MNRKGKRYMKVETFLEVVSTLIGDIEPYGDSSVDEVRQENQQKLITLLEEGIENIIANSLYRFRTEGSMKEIGEDAYNCLLYIKEGLDDYFRCI